MNGFASDPSQLSDSDRFAYDRAMECVEAGDYDAAIASFVADLAKGSRSRNLFMVDMILRCSERTPESFRKNLLGFFQRQG